MGTERERTQRKRKPLRIMKIPIVLFVACVASIKAASFMDAMTCPPDANCAQCVTTTTTTTPAPATTPADDATRTTEDPAPPATTTTKDPAPPATTTTKDPAQPATTTTKDPVPPKDDPEVTTTT